MQNDSNHNSTVLSVSRAEKSFWYISFSVLGIMIGYFLSRILSWAINIEGLPFQKRLSLITKFVEFFQSLIGGWSNLLFSLVGLLIGIYLANRLLRESPTIIVTGYDIDISNHIKLLRSEIQTIYYDEEDLVVVGVSGHELLRESYDIKKETLQNALNNHRYPFHSNDPYKTQFKVWIPNTNELPVHVNALLKARELAKKNKDKDEVVNICRELSNLGIIVKDNEDKKQYWRHVVPK